MTDEVSYERAYKDLVEEHQALWSKYCDLKKNFGELEERYAQAKTALKAVVGIAELGESLIKQPLSFDWFSQEESPSE